MGEQMAKRRAPRRPGRVVEVDRPLLERDEDRKPGEELRDGGPRQLGVLRTVRRDDSAGPCDPGGGHPRVPAVDRPQRVHSAGY